MDDTAKISSGEDVMKYRIPCLILLGCMVASPAFAVYGVGDHVADFTLNDAYGNPVSLYDYEGMAVCIQFWGDC